MTPSTSLQRSRDDFNTGREQSDDDVFMSIEDIANDLKLDGNFTHNEIFNLSRDARPIGIETIAAQN